MIETLTGNIPGFVKRITVSFYAKSWLYESGEMLELAAKGVALSLFDPVSAATAQWGAWLGFGWVYRAGHVDFFAEGI